MSVIRSFIIKEWYKFFLSATFILFLLITVSNLVSGLLRGNVTSTEVLINYLLELPKYLSMVFPLACLAGSLFSINKLKNRNELTAIFATGYSRKKFIFDIGSAALTITLLQFFLTSFVQPFAKKNRHSLITNSASKFRNLKSKGLRSATSLSGKTWYKSGNYFLSFSTYDKSNARIQDVNIYFFDQNRQISKRIDATTASYLEGNKWTFKDGRIMEDLNKERFPTSRLFEKLEYSLNEKPDDFKQIEADITTLNIFKLYKYITQLRNAGINTDEYQIIFLDKFSSAIICIVFAFLAAIPLFNPNRRNSSFGKNLIFVLIFTLLYWLVYTYVYELGNNSKIPPLVACFVVPAAFTTFLIFYFYKHRRLR